ncbi:MAG: AI-2E family transporter [Treponema sp.]
MENKKVIPAFGILALVLIMIVMVSLLFLPYASVILWASIIYMLTSPFYNKTISYLNPEKRGYGIKKRIIAAIFSVLAVVVIVSMFSFVVIKVFGQGKKLIMEVGKTLIEFLEANKNNDDSWVDVINTISMGTVDLSHFDLKKELLNIVATYSERILTYTTNFVRNIGLLVISLAFLAFSLYFFYVDGEYLLDVLKRAIPIDSKASTAIFSKIKEVTNNLFKGLFLVSFYQAIVALIIYLIFGIEGALLLAILTFFSSFLPLIGCGFIWVPVGIGLFFSSGTLKAIVFLIVAGLGISSLDNLLRPFFLKDRIKIHPFLIFFSMLGGVKLFSFNGIVLGPMIIILFFTVLDIALEPEEKHELDKKAFE